MDLEPLLRFWRANDDLFEHVEPTWWGAVVSDRRFPAIHDVNYARVETRQPVRLAEIEDHLVPALRRSGSSRPHVVIFHPDDQADLVVEASTRSERLVWDLVMEHRDAVASDDSRIGEVRDVGDAFWAAYRASLAWFGVTEPEPLDQLQAIERDVAIPAGRRWFAAAVGPDIDALAGLLVLEGVGYVDHVVTFPHARRRGLATALTRCAVATARSSGAERVYLLAEPESPAAGLYRDIGFAPLTRLGSWISERLPR